MIQEPLDALDVMHVYARRDNLPEDQIISRHNAEMDEHMRVVRDEITSLRAEVDVARSSYDAVAEDFERRGKIIDELSDQICRLTAELEAAREALAACRDQFAFYADEHTKAGKADKAATNAKFRDLAAHILEKKL